MADAWTLIVNVAEHLTVAAILLLIIAAWLRGWLVRGKDHEILRADRDKWQEIAIQNSSLAHRAVKLVQEER